MARIKFLDILEETKSKPIYNAPISEPQEAEKPFTRYSSQNTYEDAIIGESEPTFPRRRERTESSEDKLSTLRERSLLRDSGYETRETPSVNRTNRASSTTHTKNTETKTEHHLIKDDSKFLLTGALFVLFGGMLFLSGFWVGKTVTNNVRTEREVLMAQPFDDYKKIESPSDSSLSQTTMPIATTVDTTPIAPPKQELKVIEPAVHIEEPKKVATPKPAPKPVTPSKEYIIQISAHTTMDSARLVEDQLRTAGFSAYTSESVIGDATFFRVRLRGFNSKKGAEDTLAQIKTKNIGQDGFVLTLE